MRGRLVPFVLLALALPAAAFAAPSVPGDGTLSVKNGDGTITLKLDGGAVIGRVGRGRVTVIEPRSADCDALLVWEDGFRADGDEKLLRSGDFACEFRGQNIRYRFVGDQTHVVVRGRNISLSVVGRGSVVLRGDGGPDDGRYSLNGEPYESLPDIATRFAVGSG